MATNHETRAGGDRLSPNQVSLSRSDNPAINADPPAASGTPLQGQLETNPPQQAQRKDQAPPTDNQQSATTRHPAYEFGWQSYLQHGRSPSNAAPTFESLEPELERQWLERQKTAPQRQPWTEAREIARDAWQQVQDAMSGQTS